MEEVPERGVWCQRLFSGNLSGSTLSLSGVMHQGFSVSVYLHEQEQLSATVSPRVAVQDYIHLPAVHCGKLGEPNMGPRSSAISFSQSVPPVRLHR